MTEIPPDIARRLLYILYLGWLEARSRPTAADQIFDLADAMHNIPCYLAKPLEGYFECIREDLKRYHEKHPNTSYDYLPYLDGADTGHWFVE